MAKTPHSSWNLSVPGPPDGAGGGPGWLEPRFSDMFGRQKLFKSALPNLTQASNPHIDQCYRTVKDLQSLLNSQADPQRFNPMILRDLFDIPGSGTRNQHPRRSLME